VLAEIGVQDDPLLDVAKELERIALNDEYFIEKKLYPNVDFYSGITLKALGFPTSMFTVLFAVARTVGWIAQWKEMIEDPSQKIGRPRQLYTGPTHRDYHQAALDLSALVVDHQRARGLGHGLDDQHARHHRPAGEMADEERLVHRHVLDAGARQVGIHVDDAVDQQERRPMRQQLHDADDVGFLQPPLLLVLGHLPSQSARLAGPPVLERFPINSVRDQISSCQRRLASNRETPRRIERAHWTPACAGVTRVVMIQSVRALL
jgi:hypothetical protein